MVNIDTVYQRVIAIANKEQRGYITPLEYNLLANQASIATFEQYFYDRNKLADTPGNSTEYSDADKLLDEKIAIFSLNDIQVGNGTALPGDIYRLGAVYYRENVEQWASNSATVNLNDARNYEAKLISAKDWATIQNAPLLRPTNKRPIYIRDNDNTIRVFGSNNTQLVPFMQGGTLVPVIFCNYIAQPVRVEWGYDVVGEKALFNGNLNRTTFFPHHPSEETELVIKILELAGVTIEDQGIVQYGNTKEQQLAAQQKS
jgi:hypothetical protein